MKKIFTVFISVFVLFTGHLFAQGQTPYLTFRLANQVVLDGGANPDTLQFDVEVKCDTLNTYHTDLAVYLNYNTSAFGANVFTNGKIVVEKIDLTIGQIAPGPSFAFYNLAIADNTSNRILIGSLANFTSTSALNLIDTSYLPLYRVKMVITNNLEPAGLTFEEDFMEGGQFYILTSGGTLFQYNSNGFEEDLEFFPLYDLDLATVLISEIADPETPDANAKFIELYNPTTFTINFSYFEVWLNRDQNTAGWDSVKLVGFVEPDSTFVITSDSTEFHTKYGFPADMIVGSNLTGNGDDAFALSRNSGAQEGTLIDIYGELGVSGDGQPWDYTDTKAVRKFEVISPNPTFTLSEWVIGPIDPGAPGTGSKVAFANDMTPKSHRRTATWTGTVSTDWRTKGNWDLGIIPDAAHNVVVDSEPGPVINGTTNAYSNDISVAPPSEN